MAFPLNIKISEVDERGRAKLRVGQWVRYVDDDSVLAEVRGKPGKILRHYGRGLVWWIQVPGAVNENGSCDWPGAEPYIVPWKPRPGDLVRLAKCTAAPGMVGWQLRYDQRNILENTHRVRNIEDTGYETFDAEGTEFEPVIESDNYRVVTVHPKVTGTSGNSLGGLGSGELTRAIVDMELRKRFADAYARYIERIDRDIAVSIAGQMTGAAPPGARPDYAIKRNSNAIVRNPETYNSGERRPRASRQSERLNQALACLSGTWPGKKPEPVK